MVTEFISGSSGAGKGTYVIEKIRERLGNARRKYLIVPEQQAVLWEAQICRALPPSSALELEVVSFRRFADTVFRTVGGLTRVFTGEANKILLMWRAVVSVKDSLTVFRTDDGHEEKYVSTLLETLSDLRRRSVSPKMLEGAAESIDADTALSRKLSDLSVIFSAYRALEEENESEDPDCILDMLSKVLRTERFLKDCDVFIDSFYSLTPAESEILYYIMRDAADVFITFTFDDTYRGAHFDHVKEFYKSALSMASRASREVVRVRLEADPASKSADISYLEKNLWDFSAPCAEKRDGSVKVIRCADRYEEARAIACEIERAVHSGASYSDVAVIARDIETYRGILDARLDALGIPYHLSKRNGVATSPVTSLVTSLLDAVADGARRESVVRILKTGLCPVSPRECSNFEEYAATWNIRGKSAYLANEDFKMNPAGYTSGTTEWGQTVLADANAVRRALSEPLGKLFSLFEGAEAKCADICVALYDILISFGVPEAVSRDADGWRAIGKEEEAEKLERGCAAVIDSLSAMATGIPDEYMKPGAASRLFFEVASSFDVAAIPSRVDAVTLGSADGVRLGKVRRVILAGCLEGEFPAKPSDGGFFTAAERARLEELGLPLTDGSEIEESKELFRFWRCVCAPTEELVLTYPVSSSEGTPSPSVGARQVMKLMNISPVDFSSVPDAEKIFSVEGALDAALFTKDPATRRALGALSKEFPALSGAASLTGSLSADGERLAPGSVKELFPGRLNLTQARIDVFSGCPFHYYSKYVLELNEGASGKISGVDVGNLVHHILEMFFKKTSGRVYPIPDDETEELVGAITEEYISDVLRGDGASAKRRYLLSRLRRSVLVLVRLLMKEFSESSFEPYRFELKFGDSGDAPAPLVFTSGDGAKVSLYGTIDRVDRFEKDGRVYVRVVDYKTYDKKFRLDDIQKGINLQLLIYLFALWKGPDSAFRRAMAKGGEVIPAGMIYLSSDPNGAKSNTMPSAEDAYLIAESNIEKSGVLLDDDVALAASGVSDAKESGAKKGTSLVTLEEMGKIYDEIHGIIVAISDEIRSGRCESAPKAVIDGNLPCKYCKMMPVCRHIEERGKEDE